MSFEAKAFVLRRNWAPIIGCIVMLAAGVLVGRSSTSLWPFGYFAAWIGLAFAPIFLLRNAFPRATPATVRATATGITIEGHADVRNEDILEAKVLPRRGREVVVELAVRGGKTLALRTRAEDAKALVDLVGARRTRFLLMVPFGKRFLASFALFAVVFFVVTSANVGAWLLTVPGSVLWALLLGWLVGFVRGRFVVAADGFTTRWLFRERFIAFRDVAIVTSRPRFGGNGVNDVFVGLRSGRQVRLRTIESPNTEEERGAESRALLAYVNAAFEQSTRLLDGSVNVPSLVARGSRSPREWLSGLDALVRGGGSRYRVAAVSAEMLADVTNDPSAPIESRVGAAAALVRMGDDTQRTRVRIAAEGCAESDLRDTLLALCEAHDDAAAEAALASLRRR